MASLRGVTFLLLLLAASSCAGRDFIVGGDSDGWTTIPDEPYDHFKVNDTLVFLHTHVHPALWVSQRHYAACNTTQPLLRLDGGESRFVLNNTGYYYFISADAGRCRHGERLVVFAIHRKTKPNITATSHAPSTRPSPSPPNSAPPPSPSPSAGHVSSPSPAPSSTVVPTEPAPSPGSSGNASSSSLAPMTTTPPKPAPSTTVPGTNGINHPPSRSSSAVPIVRRSGVLAACLVAIVGATIILLA